MSNLLRIGGAAALSVVAALPAAAVTSSFESEYVRLTYAAPETPEPPGTIALRYVLRESLPVRSTETAVERPSFEAQVSVRELGRTEAEDEATDVVVSTALPDATEDYADAIARDFDYRRLGQGVEFSTTAQLERAPAAAAPMPAPLPGAVGLLALALAGMAGLGRQRG